MKDTSDILMVSFDSGLKDESALCVTRKYEGTTIMLKMEVGEQAEILYRLLTEQMTKAILSADPSRDMKEIEEVINCDADAETKCKMIFNILNAKPHYFEKQEPKTGWHIAHGMYEDRFWCSCGYIKIIDNNMSEWKYCPVCGARMVEQERREVND